MASFNSPSPSQMSEAMREKLARKYPGGRLITFKGHTSQSPDSFVVYARVVEDLGDSLHVVICNEENDYCDDLTNGIRAIALHKKDVLSSIINGIESTAVGAPAAGGAKNKSRRHKQMKPSKTKRKTRRAKRTRKRRA
jgi:hypothetical protein